MSAVDLLLVKNRIHALIPYDDGKGPERAKKIFGARWSGSAKAWTYALNMEVCRMLREEFGEELRISNELAAWAREELRREAEQIALRSATDADLNRVEEVAPALAAAMKSRTYQRVAAKFINDGRSVLIADEPGLGKTLETLAGIVEANARVVLVFAKKKAAEAVWGAEVPRWLGDKGEVYVAKGSRGQREAVIQKFIEAVQQGESDQNIRFLICNIEMVRLQKNAAPKFPTMFGMLWDAIVVDESHKALIGKHTRSESITQTRFGMMKLQLREGGLKVALSGTPTRGKNQNIWGTLNWLDERVFSSYWKFVERYFKVVTNPFGGRVIEGLNPDRIADYDRALAPYVLRRTKGEVAPDMPPRQYGGSPLDPSDPETTIGVWLDMEPKQAQGYARVLKGAIESVHGEFSINGILAEMTRCKQFAICGWDITGVDKDGKPTLVPVKSSNKFEWLVEFIQERQEAGLKVVVASQFTQVINAFSDWLLGEKIENYVLTGETKDRDLVRIIDAFNDSNDKVPVCLINTMAGGESINLDACADDIVFLDETYIPDDQEQVENRIHRMSRVHQVNVWYLRSRNTIEEDICRITGARDGAVKARLDGSRGVEVFRKIMEEL